MKIVLLAEMDSSGGLSRNGKIPWIIQSTLFSFREATLGHYVVVGRVTWELMNQPLPGRRVIVLTHDRQYSPAHPVDFVAKNLHFAFAHANVDGESRLYVIGGAGVFGNAFGKAHELLLTKVQGNFGCDLYFPIVYEDDWTTTVEQPVTEDHGYRYSVERKIRRQQ